MIIDWKKIAKPQSDGYDSYIIGNFLKEKYGWEKVKPTTEYTLCDGLVAVRPDPYHNSITDIINDQGDPTNSNHLIGAYEIWSADRSKNIQPYLSAWQEGYNSLKLFLDEFWPLIPYINPSTQETSFQIKNLTVEQIAKQIDEQLPHRRGCSSGHYFPKQHKELSNKYMNAVYVTITNNQGCAQGIYHEIGHLRLNALNLEIEWHDGRLFTNSQQELYESPIRRDKKRPLSAVIQAIYSWMIFGENDIQCASIKGNLSSSAVYLIGNLPKIEDGLSTIREHVRCTAEGKNFFDGYFEWGDDICVRTRQLCKEFFGEDYDKKYAEACEYKNRQVVPK